MARRSAVGIHIRYHVRKHGARRDVHDYLPTTVSSTLGVPRPVRSSRQVCASLGEDQIETYRDNARAFIASDRYRPFTKQAFAELLVEAVEEDLASRT